MLQQQIFNFAQLDTEAAQFDLRVHAAKKRNFTIGQPARTVAGAVHAPALRRKRIGQKTLRREFWTVEIAACYADAANVQFTCYADWHRLAIRIQNVIADVIKWFAYGGRFGAIGIA